MTLDQLKVALAADMDNAPRALITALVAIVDLRRPARSLLLPAGLLGGEEFAGCGV